MEEFNCEVPVPIANPTDDAQEIRLSAAIDLFLTSERVNAQLLKTKLQVTLIQAHADLEELERRGLIGPDRSPKSRKLLVTMEEWESMQKAGIKRKIMLSETPAAPAVVAKIVPACDQQEVAPPDTQQTLYSRNGAMLTASCCVRARRLRRDQ